MAFPLSPMISREAPGFRWVPSLSDASGHMPARIIELANPSMTRNQMEISA